MPRTHFLLSPSKERERECASSSSSSSSVGRDVFFGVICLKRIAPQEQIHRARTCVSPAERDRLSLARRRFHPEHRAPHAFVPIEQTQQPARQLRRREALARCAAVGDEAAKTMVNSSRHTRLASRSLFRRRRTRRTRRCASQACPKRSRLGGEEEEESGLCLKKLK